MPALQPYIIEPIWEQFEALLPERRTNHPLGSHRPRLPDRVVFGKLVEEILVFRCAYWRIADESCSESTLRRRRREEWIGLRLMEKLREISLGAYERLIIGLWSFVRPRAVDGCITKAPCCGGEKAGRRSPVDRGKQGAKRLTDLVDGKGILLGTVVAPANRHDSSPLLDATLEALEPLGKLPDRASSVHLDRGYDSKATREKLEARGLSGVIAERGNKPAPLQVAKRAGSWNARTRGQNAHKKLAWCTERCGRVIDLWVAFSDVVIIREATHPRRLEPLPLGKPTFPTTMTY